MTRTSGTPYEPMNLLRLSTIADVSKPERLPDSMPNGHGLGMVHIEVGVFHRAHQAVTTDDTLAYYDNDWRIIGISLRSNKIATKLNEQNGLFTLLTRGATETSSRVIASIDHVLGGKTHLFLHALCSPSIRLVTSTVTEALSDLMPAKLKYNERRRRDILDMLTMIKEKGCDATIKVESTNMNVAKDNLTRFVS